MPTGTTTTPSGTTVTVPPSTEAKTFLALATPGGVVYNGNCWPCHGSGGQGSNGPALWGTPYVLGTFDNAVFFDNNAQAALDFISYFMPLFAPATLSHEQYIEVLCYILLQGNQVPPLETFNESQLASITLH